MSAQVLTAETLNIVTDRLRGPAFDLVIATNVLPYFDDLELALAMSNIAAMMVPGGVLLHNEGRPILGDITTAVGLPFEQSRHVTIATVRGATAPLADSVFLHRKDRGQQVGPVVTTRPRSANWWATRCEARVPRPLGPRARPAVRSRRAR